MKQLNTIQFNLTITIKCPSFNPMIYTILCKKMYCKNLIKYNMITNITIKVTTKNIYIT